MKLEARLDVNLESEAIEFVFSVTNTGEAPVELTFRSGQAAEFAVCEHDQLVWRWSEGRMFTQALWKETLEVGGSMDIEGTWDAPDPGTYEAKATLETVDADVEARATFDV